MFNAKVMDHVVNPRNGGRLEGATHAGTAGTPEDGPYLRLWFEVADGLVKRASYETYGCPAAIACGSVLAELAPGRSSELLLKLDAQDLMRLLGGLPEGKEHCAELAIQALVRALGEPEGA